MTNLSNTVKVFMDRKGDSKESKLFQLGSIVCGYFIGCDNCPMRKHTETIHMACDETREDFIALGEWAMKEADDA